LVRDVKQKSNRVEAIVEAIDAPLATTVFKVLYLLLTFASFNSFTANQAYLSKAAYVVVGFGALLLLARLINNKKYRKMPFIPILLLFILSMVISAVGALKYGYIENLQGISWATIQFFVLYLLDMDRGVLDYRREFKLIAGIFLLYTSLATLAGLCLGLVGYTTDALEIWWYGRGVVGLFGSRLYGVYSDPNYGAVLCVIAIILTLYVMQRRRTPVIRVFGVLNIMSSLAYVSLSGSRTGLVTGIVALSFYAVMTFIRGSWARERGVLQKAIVSILLVVGVTAGFLASDFGVAKLYNTIEPGLSRYFDFEDENRAQIEEAARQLADQGDSDSADVLGRVDSENDISAVETGVLDRENVDTNPTTNRFDIWKSGWEIFKAHPLIGTSHRYLLEAAFDTTPDTYICKAWYTTLHNTFVDVLASQGIIGFVIFVSLVFGILVYIFRRITHLEKDLYSYALVLFCSLLVPATSMLFYTEVLYINTVGSVIFWMFLGYLIHLLSHERPKA
jgi:hypothetical protein